MQTDSDLRWNQAQPCPAHPGGVAQLTKRQRFLQEARALLDDTGPGFLELGLGPGYKGDSYPDSIPKLNVMLEGATSPADIVGEAIKSLKTKYDIQDADLAK